MRRGLVWNFDSNADSYDAKQPTSSAVLYERIYLYNALLHTVKFRPVSDFHPGNPGSIPGLVFHNLLRTAYNKIMSNAKPTKEGKNITDTLRLSGTWFNHDSGTARTIVGRISIEELVRLYDQHGEFLFDKNVRAFLKESNHVNQNIRNTLINDRSHEFFYLNNGITIICNKLSYSAVANDPVINLEGVQIVNGSQTTHTVHLAFKDGLIKNKEHVFVLVKIIQTEDANLLNNITDAIAKHET
ncbi:AIPR family protein [Streptomyces sp. DSM 44917]|uniref:AIPR family protein n=1 Tax=Streptomyces boetiae TaxID=3075541 RepID=A0ABU2L8E1_9ACTN|nr:AIPR family protein [Streptomyces sp. DSM 44917]MDT0307558.1 AIPR family protein [Streptomyces sp. DSM 44917]